MWRSPDLRILSLMVAGSAIFGFVDGSRWRTLLTPTLAYRPAILFGLTLVFGWRGFAWSQLVFLVSFTFFLGWRSAIFITPMYLLSHACALAAARKLARDEAWLSRQRPTLAFLAGAVLAPALPALLNNVVLRVLGVAAPLSLPASMDSWLRGTAGILSLAPALLVYCSEALRKWVGLRSEGERHQPITARNLLELSAEVAAWSVALWMTVEFRSRYGLNVTYLTFLPPLAFTLFRGMHLATLALAANAVAATGLWLQLHWQHAFPIADLRLLIAIYSVTILVLAAVVDERQRDRVQVARLQMAEAALRASGERLRFAQQVASIGTFDWNIQTGVNTWTPELEAMYGLPTGGFQGTQTAWEALVHPDDRARAVQRVKESFQTEAPSEAEWRVIWPDGRIRWVAGRWQVFKDVAGMPIRMMGVNIDVTDRRQMEEALRKSEERLRLATKATNDAIWDIDLKTGIVSWNDTYSVLYGRPKTTEDSWQFWIDRIHPEDRAQTVGDLRGAIDGGASSWIAEYRFLRVDGEWAHIYDRAYIARDASGNAWRVIGAMQDLTKQKRAEAAMRESEERFRRVFEEGPLGLALVALDYRFVKVNSALCRMVGYPEDELVRKTCADITHPDDLRADAELSERLFRREISFYRVQKRYMRKSGEIIWINLTASMLLGPDGEPLHGLAMMEDITEIKRTQEEALFRQKLESVGTLAGGIAHDFNNLLGAVKAQAELALAELDAGASCRSELSAISEVAMRGSEVVRQLMIYAGKESGVTGHADLSRTVDEMLALLKVSVTKHAVIKADLDPDLPDVHASAGELRQIVMNLITNASDAIGDRDGIIRVSTKRVTVKEDAAAFWSRKMPEGDYMKLEVSDTGHGMSLETQAKAFDPFFSTKSAGRGLGLAVVQGIVRTLGGGIHMTSAPDRGTTFQVLIPYSETAADGGDSILSPRPETPAPPRHGNILIVEDEHDLRQPIVRMLYNAGFGVFEAADGTSAIDLLRASGGRIDAILLDMTIPGASSREIIAEAANVRPDVRVIMTSAYSQEMIGDAMSPPQVRGFIRKPFPFADLLKLLRSSLLS
jgi:PAS domain S-box-containing protein